MKRKAKRSWRIWILTYWGKWILVRWITGGVALFTSKKAAMEYLLGGGFSYKKFSVLAEGKRPGGKK